MQLYTAPAARRRSTPDPGQSGNSGRVYSNGGIRGMISSLPAWRRLSDPILALVSSPTSPFHNRSLIRSDTIHKSATMLRIHRTSLRVRASRLRLAKNVANVPLGDRPRRPAGTISVGNTRSIVIRLGARTRWVSVASVATGRQIRPAKSPIGRSSCGSIGSIGIGYPRLTRVRSRPDQPSSLLDVGCFDEKLCSGRMDIKAFLESRQ